MEGKITESGRHYKARTGRPRDISLKDISIKPGGYPERFFVPDDKESWDIPYPEYTRENGLVYFVDNHVIEHSKSRKERDNLGLGWADYEDVTRATIASSFTGKLRFSDDGRPLNPMGRTGIEGRGQLGKWGPNKAGDAIITKDSEDESGEREILLVQRSDGQWAIPGGMVDSGEKAIQTAFRELFEETITEGQELTLEQESFKKELKEGAEMVYEGYVDDERNTDNAWMETSVYRRHISKEIASKMKLKSEVKGGGKPQWVRLSDPRLKKLFASHSKFVEMAIK